ncbi:MAG TPA: hypothetical protein VIS95_08105 [Solirubrobacterales bacterium]
MLLVWLATATAASAAPGVMQCNRTVDDATRGKRLKPPIALTPAAGSAQRQLNFGADRGEKVMRRLVLSASKRLPPTLTSEQIAFEALLSRSGDSLESTDFAEPTFTSPKISADRRSIVFSACFDASGISAGKYVGSITVSGPVGLGAAAVSVTVNAKDSGLFVLGVIIAIIAAFLLLLVKDASAVLSEHENKWRKAFGATVADPRWWVITVGALAAAFGALITAYDTDPAWGASGFSSLWTLVGSALAAIGGQSILTSLKSR